MGCPNWVTIPSFPFLKDRIGCDLEVERNSAFTLSNRLGGHTLAISHMASPFHDGELFIHEFMTIYIKNP